MNTKPFFTSVRQNWKTPDVVYANLDYEFCFTGDPCPSNPDFDGLLCDWSKVSFLNPPYNQIKAWLRKAVDQYQQGKVVVALLPSRTGTDWFHEYVLPYATEIRFIRGRLQFDDCGVNAPFDSIITVYKE